MRRNPEQRCIKLHSSITPSLSRLTSLLFFYSYYSYHYGKYQVLSSSFPFCTPNKEVPSESSFSHRYHNPDRTHSSILTQSILHYPLPPWLPVTVPSMAPQLVYTFRLINSPIYPNNFDRAIDNILQESASSLIPGEGQKDEGRGDPLIPKGQGKIWRYKRGRELC